MPLCHVFLGNATTAFPRKKKKHGFVPANTESTKEHVKCIWAFAEFPGGPKNHQRVFRRCMERVRFAHVVGLPKTTWKSGILQERQKRNKTHPHLPHDCSTFYTLPSPHISLASRFQRTQKTFTINTSSTQFRCIPTQSQWQNILATQSPRFAKINISFAIAGRETSQLKLARFCLLLRK